MLNKFIFIIFILNCTMITCMGEAPKISQKGYAVRVEAENLQKLKKFKEAIAIIDAWESKNKKELHYNLYEFRGSLWALLNEYQKAKKDYFKAYQLYPTIHNVTSLGYCHLQLEDYFVAENVFRNAMIKFPETVNLKKGLLQCLFHQKRFVESLALVKSLLIEDEDDVELLTLSGQIYWQSDNLQKAYGSYQYIVLLGKAETKHFYALMDLSLLLEIPDRAVIYGEKIISSLKKIDSQRAENLGLLFINQKEFVRAEKWIRIALKNITGKEKKDHLLIYLADALKESDSSKAKKILADVKDPLVKKGRYYYLLGSLFESDKNINKAIAHFLEAKSFEAYRISSSWKLFSLYQIKDDADNCLKILLDLQKTDSNNSTIKKLIKHYSAHATTK